MLRVAPEQGYPLVNSFVNQLHCLHAVTQRDDALDMPGIIGIDWSIPLA